MFKVGDRVEYLFDNGCGCDAIVGKVYTIIEKDTDFLFFISIPKGNCVNIEQIKYVKGITYLGGE